MFRRYKSNLSSFILLWRWILGEDNMSQYKKKDKKIDCVEKNKTKLTGII